MLGTISNGVINFSFTANTSNSARTANITVLGFKIKVRQNDAAPAITSANNATFTVGTAGTFTVTATGSPAPAVSVTGALPIGVTFDTSTNTLSGTPAAGQGRTYNIVFTAGNGVGTNAVQGFKLTVLQLPTVTSLNNTTFTVGVKGSFTVVATGFPAPAVSITGALPNGVTFDLNKRELSGTPAAYTGGVYPIQFTASNGTVPSIQNFILTVNQPPVFTSVPYVLFTATPATFSVTTAGFPAPSFSQTGTLPTGVTFNATTKMLSWTPSVGVTGSYPIQFIARNLFGPNTIQTFTLTVSQTPPVRRHGRRRGCGRVDRRHERGQCQTGTGCHQFGLGRDVHADYGKQYLGGAHGIAHHHHRDHHQRQWSDYSKKQWGRDPGLPDLPNIG